MYSRDCLYHVHAHLHAAVGVVSPGFRQPGHAVVTITQNFNTEAVVLLRRKRHTKKTQRFASVYKASEKDFKKNTFLSVKQALHTFHLLFYAPTEPLGWLKIKKKKREQAPLWLKDEKKFTHQHKLHKIPPPKNCQTRRLRKRHKKWERAYRRQFVKTSKELV